MAVKIVHAERSQEIRFGDRKTAERYAERHGGGLSNWQVLTVPRPASAADSPNNKPTTRPGAG